MVYFLAYQMLLTCRKPRQVPRGAQGGCPCERPSPAPDHCCEPNSAGPETPDVFTGTSAPELGSSFRFQLLAWVSCESECGKASGWGGSPEGLRKVSRQSWGIGEAEAHGFHSLASEMACQPPHCRTVGSERNNPSPGPQTLLSISPDPGEPVHSSTCPSAYLSIYLSACLSPQGQPPRLLPCPLQSLFLPPSRGTWPRSLGN